MIDLAYAMSQPPAGQNPTWFYLSQLPFMLAIFAIFFFLIIRPQQQERKRRDQMLANLKKGDRVITTGGLIGTILGINERTVTLRIADSVRVECLRSAVNGLYVPAEAEKESA